MFNTIKVIIVDPDIDFSSKIRKSLERLGNYQVSVFVSGDAAQEKLQAEAHDFVVIDTAVPDPNFLLGAMRRLRPATAFIVSNPHAKPIGESHRIVGTLPKPYLARQLEAVIRAAIRGVPASDASLPPPDSLPEDLSDGATIADVMRTMPEGAALPPPVPPLPTSTEVMIPVVSETSATAQIALEIADDPTVPLEGVAAKLAQEAESLPPESRQAWIAPVQDGPNPADLEEKLATGWMETLKNLQLARPVPPEPDTTPGLLTPDLETTNPFKLTQPVPTVPGKADPDPIAAIALQLTQLTVESSAVATLVTRGGEILAVAGKMPEGALPPIQATLSQWWRPETPPDPGVSRMKGIKIGTEVQYLLYSVAIPDGLALSMLFAKDAQLGLIRQQARQLSEALTRTPDPAAEGELPAAPEPSPLNLPPADLLPPPAPSTAAEPPPPATWTPVPIPAPPPSKPAPDKLSSDDTLLTRPTSLRPPPGLRETPRPPDKVGEAPPTTLPEAPVQTSCFVLLPSTPTFADSEREHVASWLRSAAESQNWRVVAVEVQATYALVQVALGPTESPTLAADILMRESADRAGRAHFWADLNYVVSPGREITPNEIAELQAFRRELEQTR